MIRYSFEHITCCEMCGDDTSSHTILGQRLNCSQGFKPRHKEGISVSVKQCKNCHLIYSSPQPQPFDIQDHYGVLPESYWTASYFEWNEIYFSDEIVTAKELLSFSPGMTALDVGAGLGKCMLSLEAAGFDTYGLEPSEPFYQRAISKMNISPERLKLGMVEDMDYPGSFFNFITFGAVLEHLYHPAACIKKALGWLKPGGILQIEVPSSQYLISKLVNTYNRLTGTNFVTNISPMHFPFHLYEFHIKSFTELGKQLNFRIARADYLTGIVPFKVPGIVSAMLTSYMKSTQTGMQLTVWLKKL